MEPILSGRLIPARALDVRPAAEFANSPTTNSANIGVDELAERVYELPAAGTAVNLFVTGAEVESATRWLEHSGRPVHPVEPMWGTETADRFRLWTAPEFLVETSNRLEPGRALCLACGVGREAVHLAALGWEVVAIDRLADAIVRGEKLERRYVPAGAPPIRWLLHDLRTPLDSNLGEFDLVCELFAWQETTPDHLGRMLAPGGTALFEDFTGRHRSAIDWQRLQIEGESTGWREQRETSRLLLRPDEKPVVRD